MAEGHSMTAADRAAKSLLDEHADVLREAVATVVAQLMEAEIGASLSVRSCWSRQPPRPLDRRPMATQEDVRRIALSLPATSEDPNGFRFFVEGKQFAWSWLERVDPGRARIPSADVIAVRVADVLTGGWRSRAPKRLLADGIALIGLG